VFLIFLQIASSRSCPLTAALQARLTDFTDYRTPADMELTHLGTLKMLLSEVLLLAGEQRQTRKDLQLALNRLRQDPPEDAVNPPPSSPHERKIADGSMACIRELQATVSNLVDEVVGLRSALQGNVDDKSLCSALPGSSVPNLDSSVLLDRVTRGSDVGSASVQQSGEAALVNQEILSIDEQQESSSVNSVTTSRLTRASPSMAAVRISPQISSHSRPWRRSGQIGRNLRCRPTSSGGVKEESEIEAAADPERPVESSSSEAPSLISETSSCLISESNSKSLHRHPGRMQAASILDYKRLHSQLIVAARPGPDFKTQEMAQTHKRRVDAACDTSGNEVVFVSLDSSVEPYELLPSSSGTVLSSRHRAVRQHHLAAVQPHSRIPEQSSSEAQESEEDVNGAISFEELREGLARLTCPQVRISSSD
jgi:hypothetical protein